MSSIKFEIAVPTDQGFFGNQCVNSNCGKYFKVFVDDIKEELYCPYCGNKASKIDLRTKEQDKFIHDSAIEKAKEIVYAEIDKTFGKLSRQTRRNSFITIKHKPLKYKAKKIHRKIKEEKVDTELTCPECNIKFQVYGIFGYCPGCKSENLIVYDTNVQIIKKEFKKSENKERALRHAYSDLVTAFETYCNKKTKSDDLQKPSFQEIYETRAYFKKSLNKDIFENLTNIETLTIRRVFQKRHLYIHNDGIINEKYVKKIPEDKNLLGEKAELSFEEFESATLVVRKVIDNIVG